MLAESTVYGGSPDAWKQGYATAESATAAELQAVVSRWVTKAPFVLSVEPAEKRVAATAGADRSRLPLPADDVPVVFPQFQRATLSNGLKLIVVERPELPVQLRRVFGILFSRYPQQPFQNIHCP